jgi:hypothetical protein
MRVTSQLGVGVFTIAKAAKHAKASLRVMHLSRLVSLLLLSALQTASADVDVEAKGGLLTVRARAVPLAELLDRLSRETGMKLTYDGRRPSQLMTVNLEHLSEAETVCRILEGVGLNYALQTDTSGRRVESLIISEILATGPLAPATRAPSPRQAYAERAPEPAPLEEPAQPEEDQPPNFQATSEVPLSQGAERDRPGAPNPPFSPTFSPSGMAAPVFPSPVSNPFVFPPSFPRDASNPFPR